MIQKPMDVLEYYPVRKTMRQKSRFRSDAQEYLQSLGYDITVEKGLDGSRNIVIGNPKTANYLVTAHYDTCVRLPFPNFITPFNLLLYLFYNCFLTTVIITIILLITLLILQIMPSNFSDSRIVSIVYWGVVLLLLWGPANKTNANDNTSGVVTVLELARRVSTEQWREKVCFVLFDLEEVGMFGSATYQFRHKKETRQQVIINLDCVGDGNEIILFPNAKLKKEFAQIESLERLCGNFGKKPLFYISVALVFFHLINVSFPMVWELLRSKEVNGWVFTVAEFTQVEMLS